MAGGGFVSTPRSEADIASKRNEKPARFGREGIPLSVTLAAIALLILLLVLVYA
jgi:hypothetical protein